MVNFGNDSNSKYCKLEDVVSQKQKKDAIRIKGGKNLTRRGMKTGT